MSDTMIISFFTILAILLGPILSIIVSRINDDRRAEKERKFDIFRTLMRTRGLPIHKDHVGALNLVEVDFVKHREVIDIWKKYLVKLGEDLPPIEDKNKYDKALLERDSLLTDLIYKISYVLKIKIEQLDIFKGNYVPRGWHENDWERHLIRRGIINITHGKAPITVKLQKSHQLGLFDPPPSSHDHT